MMDVFEYNLMMYSLLGDNEKFPPYYSLALGEDKKDTRKLKKISKQIRDKLYRALKASCPVLSGNMRNHITQRGKRIVISGPSYDLNLWKAKGRISKTVDIQKGKTRSRFVSDFDYAYWVNEYGAFGTKHNNSLPSKGWVDRAILRTLVPIARSEGAILIYKIYD